MTLAGSEDVQLDRAHAESKVIASNLKHLAVVLSEADGSLRDELEVLTFGFGMIVDKIGDASASSVPDEE